MFARIKEADFYQVIKSNHQLAKCLFFKLQSSSLAFFLALYNHRIQWFLGLTGPMKTLSGLF